MGGPISGRPGPLFHWHCLCSPSGLDVFIPVLINSMRAMSTVSDKYWELASVCQLSRWTTIRRVVIPACLHPILTGLRLGLSQAWLALVTVELLASSWFDDQYLKRALIKLSLSSAPTICLAF
jgi:ABC-type anion transport system duplicated permease subunit